MIDDSCVSWIVITVVSWMALIKFVFWYANEMEKRKNKDNYDQDLFF